MIDNYDSFTYNVVHYLEALGADVDIYRNDKITLDAVNQYENIVLSPGPGIPEEAGLLLPIIEKYSPTKKILGICLGHQAIGQVFGAELYNIGQVVHGKKRNTVITHHDIIFQGIDKNFDSGRYHSWAIRNIQSPLITTAIDDEGIIMAIRHEIYNVCGVQFHPESIMTSVGMQILENWLNS
jgi:anthranilate synthase component 2